MSLISESEQSMTQYESATPSEKPCPRCKELLYWSHNETPPHVDFNTRTGYVYSAELMRYCLNCGYREMGFVNIDKAPLWTPIEVAII